MLTFWRKNPPKDIRHGDIYLLRDGDRRVFAARADLEFRPGNVVFWCTATEIESTLRDFENDEWGRRVYRRKA